MYLVSTNLITSDIYSISLEFVEKPPKIGKTDETLCGAVDSA